MSEHVVNNKTHGHDLQHLKRQCTAKKFWQVACLVRNIEHNKAYEVSTRQQLSPSQLL